MVARTRTSETAARERKGCLILSPAGLLLGWRRLLTRLLTAVRRERSADGRAAGPLGGAVARYLSDPAGALSAADDERIAELRAWGLTALVFGAAVTTGIALLVGRDLRSLVSAAGDAVWLIAWAYLRRAIMGLSAGQSESTRGAVDAAWAPALMPFAPAVTFPLDILALAASWWLTYRGMSGRGAPLAAARRATLLAFGGQVVVGMAAWLARGALLALFAAR